jgi:CPA2 family monovalent cation:H+ antiporter-2
MDYPMVRRALADGAPLIYGDAAKPAVLDAARIDTASTMVIALNGALAAQQAAAYAISRNDRLYVVARAHSAQEEAALRRIGVAQVITAERQLGNELVRHTLIRYGVSDREIDAMLRRRG